MRPWSECIPASFRQRSTVGGMDTHSAPVLGDLGKFLDRQGIPLREVKGFRLVAQRGIMNSRLFLEVKRYVTDDTGERFAVRWPTGNWVVAYETLRFPLTALGVDGPPEHHDAEVEYDDADGNRVVRKASEIVEEQCPTRQKKSVWV